MIRFPNPHDPYAAVITVCWLLFAVVWVVSAMFVKRTVERSMGWPRLLSLAAAFMVFQFVYRIAFPRQTLWPQTAAVGLIADLLTVAGLVVAIWSRAAIGRNWSGSITFKENHELIQHGPYAYVRHPIYSGLLLMVLGTAVESTRLASFLVLAMAVAALAIKAHFEEKMMTRHFPEAYAQYRRRVKALIPGVW